MSQVHFLQGRQHEKVVFDYFFRQLPFGGGYAILAGVDTLLDILEDFSFSVEDLSYIKSQGLDPRFIEYLKTLRFTGSIRGLREGDLIFPNAPILQIEANIIEAQIIETVVLNILNFQSLIATKASRMRDVAKDKTLIDFGMRRAQGPGSYYASRAAVIGGFDATSHVRAARDFGIPVSGTMAHAFIQSYDSELQAFEDYAESQEDKCVLLVDTYDTLKSGVPNAILVGKKLEAEGHKLMAIRLDSGDLSYLAKESRAMLDQAGLHYVKIAASNQLDEYVIKSLEEQRAPIDIFGVGTRLVTGMPDGALDGVYKLAWANDKPRIKLSENPIKTTLPGRKKVLRVQNEDGQLEGADVICLDNESTPALMHHPHDRFKSKSLEKYQLRPLMNNLMIEGARQESRTTLQEITKFSQSQLKSLPEEYKRFENPHLYKIGISSKLRDARNALIEKYHQ
ncbi:UNVERIFIED_CONTAM: hypothetical protein GTU68_034032 [Idotea baltica]|nr:hypothetical protein [Idotea baltica]